MVDVERRQIVGVAAAEPGVLLEQALLQIEAECLGLMVGVTLGDFVVGETIDLAILEQHVEQRLVLELRRLAQQLRRPYLIDAEARKTPPVATDPSAPRRVR